MTFAFYRELKDSHGVPRSSRLRDKKKNEGEIMIKETFVGSVIENNNFLSILLDKSSCVIIPEIKFPLPSFPTSMAPEVTVKQGLIAGTCSISQKKAEDMLAYGNAIDEIKGFEKMSESQSSSATTSSACNGRKLYETKFGMVNSSALLLNSEIQSGVIEKGGSHQGCGLLDQGRLPCVQCGILSYACVAIIQPKEAAVQYVISQECMSSSAKHGEIMKSNDTSNWITTVPPQGHSSETDDNRIHNMSSARVSDRCRQLYTSSTHGCASALGLLASAYESSDSDEEAEAPDNISNNSANNDAVNGITNIQSSGTSVQYQNTNLHLYEEGCDSRATVSPMKPVENMSIAMTQASIETDMTHLADLGESLTAYDQCKKKSSKCKASDDLSNVEKRLQKMVKKVSTKKHKNDKTNRQFQEKHSKDNNVDLLHEDNGDEATQENWDGVQQKTNDVKVKSRGKMHSGKKKASKCQTSDGLHNGDNEAKFSCDTDVCHRDKATIDKWEEIPKEKADDVKVKSKMQSGKKKASKHPASDGLRNGDKGAKFSCDIEGCDMSFSTQQDLALHKRDICPVKGCKKKFFCHKYLLQHRKVHLDERPLMCSFTGCKKTFKWPWARTEHMRVHTGVRPYACTEPGCTQTFRFVSDFSRHKRKTGHSCDKKKKNST
uniref:C2H2-type domain-containing protein n=1 Tax=Setaria italica TaxID=4555 RepID=K3Z4E6_SETIT